LDLPVIVPFIPRRDLLHVLLQYRDHVVVADLAEVVEELANGVKVRRHVQTDQGVLKGTFEGDVVD
jgi:hypothetical protein